MELCVAGLVLPVLPGYNMPYANTNDNADSYCSSIAHTDTDPNAITDGISYPDTIM